MRTINKLFFAAPLLVLATATALPRSTPAPTVGDAELAPALAPALNSISANNIAADINFIASDELEGRDTPSRGLRIAARFIRARLAALGIEPGAPNGYFYEYPLQFDRIDPEATYAKLGDRELIEGEDYFAHFSTSEHLDISGGLVLVGEEDPESFEKFAAKGQWAVTIGADARSNRKARAAAEQKGVVGVLRLLPDKSTGWRSLSWSYKRAAAGSLQFPKPESDRPAEPEKPGLPFLFMRESLFAELQGLNLEELEPGTILPGTLRDVREPDKDNGHVILENVCGFWRGSDPVLSNEVIIISAHYDHVGTKGGEIYNGADDNGSGTTGLLALAEALTSYGKLRRSVMLMWVSGEEKGLYGSRAWTEKPWLPEGCHAVADINIDMVGRNAPDKLLVTPTSEHDEYNGLTRLAERLAPLEGFPVLGSADEYYTRSDHYNFRKNLEIPVAFLFSDVHEDYHKPTDTADKIDYDKIRRVARLVMRMLDAMQSDVLDF